jgi:zinc D-Ala-D-Ala dipeptidase
MKQLFLALIFAASCAPQAGAQERPDSFVDAASVVPGLVVDMRYFGSNNFVGRPVNGYEANVCLLRREAATALAAVQAELAASGRGLKMLDCYRPERAVADFAAWALDLSDQRTKPEYYPNVDKSRLFELQYIARTSGHSRGWTVDLTMIDLATGAEIDMGTPYDMFDPRSAPADPSVPAAARENRMALQHAMQAHGFGALRTEWWHFSLRNPPDRQAFDFPVR